MKVCIYYENGLIDLFDTQNWCAGEPFRAQGIALAAEFKLLLDAGTLARDGIILETFWYDAAQRDDLPGYGESNLQPAARKQGRMIRLASKEELEHVVKVTCDGELLLWRQGGELINGVKFSIAELLCYSDASTKSINRRASALYEYTRKAHPELNDEEAAELIGYTKLSLDYISQEEFANIDEIDEADEGQ